MQFQRSAVAVAALLQKLIHQWRQPLRFLHRTIERADCSILLTDQRTDRLVILDFQRRLERSSIHCSADHRHTASLLYGQPFFVDIPHVVIFFHERHALD